MSLTRILILDGGDLARLNLPARLALLNCEVVGQTSLGGQIIELAGQLRPDLLVVDVHLEGEVNAFQAAGQIAARYGIPSIFLSGRPMNGEGGKSALGFILQPDSEHSLEETITEVLRKTESKVRLFASEEKYRALFDLMAQGVVYQDAQGRVISMNPAAERLLGLSLAQMQGFSSLDRPVKTIHADGTEFPRDFRPALEALRTGQDVSNVVVGILRPDSGEYVWLRMHSRPQFASGSDSPAMVITTFEDITDIKKNQDRLKANEAQLRKFSMVLDQSGDNIVITDTKGNIEYVNPQFEQTTGYSLAEVVGQNPRILKSGEQTPELYRELWQTIKSGHIWRGELHNKRKDGSLYWEEVSIAPVVDENGIPTNFVAIKKEITERKQLEQELQIKDKAIDSSLNAFALADLYGRLTYINPAFLDLWGYSSTAEVLGQNLSRFWHEDMPVVKIIHALRRKGGWQGEMHTRRKDGTTLEVDVSAHMVRDDAGNPLCFMSSFVDITARKQAEAAEREEHRLAEALRNTAEALNASLKLDDVFEKILENTGRVVPNDSMTIMLVEGDKLRLARHRGYLEHGALEYLENNEFGMDDFPSLRTMIDTRQPVIIPDVRNSGDWKLHPQMEWIRSYAGVPICRREEVIGFLNLDSATVNFFTPAHGARLQAFASQAAVAIENARLYEQDHILSITDGLTGLYNSRYFYDLAHQEFERSRRYPANLSVVMIDVDHFKQVNDTFGHLVGDEALREIARRLKNCMRVVDIAARYGGEEFVILMAQTDQCEASKAAERIRKAVQEDPIISSSDQVVSLTISLGVASLVPRHQSLDQLVKSADDALYQAKAAGRNQIMVWAGN